MVGLLSRAKHALAHWIAKISSLTVGAVYVSGPFRQFRSAQSCKQPRPQFSGRTAVVGHVYYPELLPEIIDCFDTLPSSAHLILTTPKACYPDVIRQLAGLRNARVVEVENRGRDIAPFIQLLSDGSLDQFDVVLKLHTKRSLHLLDGNIRRRILFERLAGNRRRTAVVLKQFDQPQTGMVGWKPSWRESSAYWMTNKERVEALVTQFNIPNLTSPAFFEGSMFWVRPAALLGIRNLGLTWRDFEPESGQLDGALHHAIERIFAYSAVADGFDVCGLSGDCLLQASPPRRRQNTA